MVCAGPGVVQGRRKQLEELGNSRKDGRWAELKQTDSFPT